MAYLMVTLGSGRKNGFTSSIMKAVVENLHKVNGLIVEEFHLHNFTFGPCTSCFECIRNIGTGCILNDDWGRKSEGILYKAFKRANGFFMVDSVHQCGTSAMGKLFMERIYPVFWEGITYGLPFASVSCASNQGFQTRANVEYCKISAGHGFQYIGGLPVHTAYIKEAIPKAIDLGFRLAKAALKDAQYGRKKLTDKDIFLMYMGKPWDIVDGYLDNITNSTFAYESSVPVRALNEGTFTNKEALKLLKKACVHLKRVLNYYNKNDRRAAAIELAILSKYWTNATFKQFLEKDVIKAAIPQSYRSIEELVISH